MCGQGFKSKWFGRSVTAPQVRGFFHRGVPLSHGLLLPSIPITPLCSVGLSWKNLLDRPAYSCLLCSVASALADLPGMAQAKGYCDLAFRPVDLRQIARSACTFIVTIYVAAYDRILISFEQCRAEIAPLEDCAFSSHPGAPNRSTWNGLRSIPDQTGLSMVRHKSSQLHAVPSARSTCGPCRDPPSVHTAAAFTTSYILALMTNASSAGLSSRSYQPLPVRSSVHGHDRSWYTGEELSMMGGVALTPGL